MKPQDFILPRVGTQLLDAWHPFVHHLKELSDRHPHPRCDPEEREEPAIKLIVVCLFWDRRCELAQHIVTPAVGLQVLAGRADIVRPEDEFHHHIQMGKHLRCHSVYSVTVRVRNELDVVPVMGDDVYEMMRPQVH